MKTNLLDIKPESLFSKELAADNETKNYTRQVEKACFSWVETLKPSSPELIHYSKVLLDELDLVIEDKDEFLQVMSGAKKFNDFKAFTMCYGGHQFGHWAGQLGDGRAINIAELTIKEKPLTLQLKGSGPTPYSRRADGLAVLRSSIREYLCSEAMHHLGVPTTRALSLVKTGDWVPRDMLYDGNQEDEHGAVVCRVAESFIRIGSFEIFAARKDHDTLKQLTDFTIKQHFKHLGEPSKAVYLGFFQEVVDRTRDLMIEWQRVGFVHGVMNTDNLSILGLTIDYGPYGWLEDYNEGWTPNTTDAQNKRYRFGNQSQIALWNLVRLANALYPLIEEAEPMQEILSSYQKSYKVKYHEMMCAKLGLQAFDNVPQEFIKGLTNNLQSTSVDMTLFYREISSVQLHSFEDLWAIVKETSYLSLDEISERENSWSNWYRDYSLLLKQEGRELEERQATMKLVNPNYVLRNYMAQMAIDKANEGDYSLVNELYELLTKPYAEQEDMQKWYAKRPDWAKHKVGCSMLSCSS